ncbi:16S rRNA (guanine(966)-N(2))-methyltransferase RsmD [Veronia pacifica]|uniref:Ribosomal RNA small subunit methyltransferase D n=1 Tax=Veronia pacifica TaxID=1080227 RepID=A0A1C3EJ48_9GAMM|nr:16S rRNA (guanine(966)-N(2))-methyltransferase RsmD [Veronia pacifica]ODA33254.1 16S rRNA (guanine(966)-N(2))-methyltransferase RsmD [Veronia pacifica]
MTRRSSKNINPNRPATHKGRGRQNTGTPGFVRIIGGRWRGRKLPVTNVEGLRPTTDRVKETVFNWLMSDIYQARCMDVFAGSGSLGLEALSRQAGFVTLVEKDPVAARQLTQNLQTLAAKDVNVVNQDALAVLKQQGEPQDIVFVDPPFRKDLLQEVFSSLEQNGWLTVGSLIYVECEKELAELPTPTSWSMFKEKTAGQVTFRLYVKEG